MPFWHSACDRSTRTAAGEHGFRPALERILTLDFLDRSENLILVGCARLGKDNVGEATNLPFKRWDTVFPNASCAVALIDRLSHHAEILPIEGRSYRRREAEPSQQERNRKRLKQDDAAE